MFYFVIKTNAEKFPFTSQRTRCLANLALSKVHQDEETDSEIDSGDFYVPEDVNILPPIVDSEVDVDLQLENEDDEVLLDKPMLLPVSESPYQGE